MHSHSGCWPYPCVQQGHSSKQYRHDPFGTLFGASLVHEAHTKQSTDRLSESKRFQAFSDSRGDFGRCGHVHGSGERHERKSEK